MKQVVIFCAFLLSLVAFTSAQTGLSEEDQAEIIRAHNQFRGQVDPIATNMEEMVWDEELAYMAQFWAGNCEYELNENRHTQSSTFSYVGQSMAAASGYSHNYTVMIRRWFELGKVYYNYYSRTCTDADGNEDEEGEACWPYTQLVWAKSYAVGCGSMMCQELRGAEDYNENAIFLVCNYGPGGNVYYGEAPYETGTESCTQCPSEKPYCKGNLCAESGAKRGVELSLIGLFAVALISFSL